MDIREKLLRDRRAADQSTTVGVYRRTRKAVRELEEEFQMPASRVMEFLVRYYLMSEGLPDLFPSEVKAAPREEYRMPMLNQAQYGSCLLAGLHGERVVVGWLADKGQAPFLTQCGLQKGGARLRLPSGKTVISPDIWVYGSDGKPYWMEAKWRLHGAAFKKEWVTGTEIDRYEGYKALADELGQPVKLGFLIHEPSWPEPGMKGQAPCGFFVQDLSVLRQHEDNKTYKRTYNPHGMINWSFSLFECWEERRAFIPYEAQYLRERGCHGSDADLCAMAERSICWQGRKSWGQRYESSL